MLRLNHPLQQTITNINKSRSELKTRANNQYSHLADRPNNTDPQSKQKKLSLNYCCPLALDMLPCRTVAFIRHGTSSAAYGCRRLTYIIAGAIEIVATVHSDVNRMHLGPAVSCAGFGEVACRGRKRIGRKWIYFLSVLQKRFQISLTMCKIDFSDNNK